MILEFKFTREFKQDTNNTGWLASGSECSWFGVGCENGHVTMLSLTRNQMWGALPAELGQLSQLTYLPHRQLRNI